MSCTPCCHCHLPFVHSWQTEDRLIKGLLALSFWLGKRMVTAAHPSARTLYIHLVGLGACLHITYSHTWHPCRGLRNSSCTFCTHQKPNKVPLLSKNNPSRCYSLATEQQVNLQMLCSTIHIPLVKSWCSGQIQRWQGIHTTWELEEDAGRIIALLW